MANPSIVVRVAANLAELKANLKEGRDQVEVVTAGMSKLVNSFSGDKLAQHARNIVAAINEVGVSSLTAAEKTRSLDAIERAMEKLELRGEKVPTAFRLTADALRVVAEEAIRVAGPMESVEEHLKRVEGLAANFGGDNAIRSAHEYAAAVEQAGGASRLTADHQALVNRAVEEGVAAYRRMGQDPPASLLALADATKQVEAASVRVVGPVQNLESHLGKIQTLSARFGGDDAIQSAHQYAAAVEQIGGAARLTKDQQVEINKAVTEGIAAYERMGEKAPADLRKLAAATAEGQAPAAGLASSYKAFDGALQAVGINIGAQVKGIEDIASASGKSVAGLGLMGAAGLAVGAGVAGWGLGRAIADFFELDEAIGGVAARLMGYGDIASEVAGAKQDTINLAIANGAKETISYAEAILFNQEAIKTASNTYTDWEQQLVVAHEAVAKLTDEEIRQIQIARSLGATQEQLNHQFGVTANTVKALDEVLKVRESNLKQLANLESAIAKERERDVEQALKAAEQNAKKFANLEAENTALVVSMSGTRRQTKLAEIDAWFEKEVAALNKLDPQYGQFYDKLARQRELKKQQETADYDFVAEHSKSALDEEAAYQQATLDAMIIRAGEFSSAQIQQQKDVRDAAIEAARNWRDSYIVAADEVVSKSQEAAAKVIADREREAARVAELFQQSFTSSVQPLGQAQINALGGDAQARKRLQELEDRSTRTPRGLFEGVVTQNQWKDAQEMQYLLSQLRMYFQGSKAPGFANGVENFGGGLARVHRDELLVNMPSGTDVIPKGQWGGGGSVTVTNHIVIQGPVVGGIDQLAEKLTASIMKKMRGQGFREPVGA